MQQRRAYLQFVCPLIGTINTKEVFDAGIDRVFLGHRDRDVSLSLPRAEMAKQMERSAV